MDAIKFLTAKGEAMKSAGRISYGDTFITTAASLTAFKKASKIKPAIHFTNITQFFLRDYEAWMRANGKSDATIGIYTRNIRVAFNDAISANFVSADKYPFGLRGYKITTSSESREPRTLDEISVLFDFRSGIFKKDRSLGFWLLSYMCNGVNIKDLLWWKWSNVDLKANTFRFNREKSKRTSRTRSQVSGVLFPQALDIIERFGSKSRKPNEYVFPIISDDMSELEKERTKNVFIAVINRHMKKIGEELGIAGDLRTYVARHSFSNILMQADAPIAFISKSLGHSKISTTEAYLGKFSKEKSEEFLNSIMPKKL